MLPVAVLRKFLPISDTLQGTAPSTDLHYYMKVHVLATYKHVFLSDTVINL